MSIVTEALLCSIVAILFHGTGHLVAGILCGTPLTSLRLSATGLRLQTEAGMFPSYEAEALTALGGPVGNLCGNALCILLARLFDPSPFAAFITEMNATLLPLSLYLALFNLLPITGFDGGRLVYCILCKRKRHLLVRSPETTPAQADRVLTLTSALCLSLLWFCAVYLLLRGRGAVSLYVFCAELFLSLIGNDPGRK